MKAATGLLLSGMLAAQGLGLAAAADSAIRDPMRPPLPVGRVAAKGPAVPSGPRVTALFLSGDSRVAVVDGKSVRAGDEVSGVRIEAILDDGVRYRRGSSVLVARISREVPRVARLRAGEGS